MRVALSMLVGSISLVGGAVGCRTTANSPPSKWQVNFQGASAVVNYADANGSTLQAGVQTLDTCESDTAGVVRCANADGWFALWESATRTGRLGGPNTPGTVTLTCSGDGAQAVCNEAAAASAPSP